MYACWWHLAQAKATQANRMVSCGLGGQEKVSGLSCGSPALAFTLQSYFAIVAQEPLSSKQTRSPTIFGGPPTSPGHGDCTLGLQDPRARAPRAHATGLRRPGGNEGTRPWMRRSCVRESSARREANPGKRARLARCCYTARSRNHRARGRQRLGATSRRKPRLGQLGGPLGGRAGRPSNRRPRCDFPSQNGTAR
jgi:hypothetical protein